MKQLAIILALAAGLMLGACGDQEHATCTDHSECGSFEACERNYCKGCEALCEDHDDCTAPAVCEDYGNDCRICR